MNKNTISSVTSNTNLHIVQLKNLKINFDGINDKKGPVFVIDIFKSSIEHLEIENATFRTTSELSSFFDELPNLKSLNLNACSLNQHQNKFLATKSTLTSISFNKCNDNIFKAFSNQIYVEKVTIRNDDWTWNGFPHEIVNDVLSRCKNLKQLVLIGDGTGSFFDLDDFTFKLKVLDTTMIIFHWYVGIKNGRIGFLETQKGTLEELTIHKLPYDFDGGKVLKFIIEEMNLKKLHYGKIPLILNYEKQDVKEIEANEIQITSVIEMFRQFPCKELNFIFFSSNL